MRIWKHLPWISLSLMAGLFAAFILTSSTEPAAPLLGHLKSTESSNSSFNFSQINFEQLFGRSEPVLDIYKTARKTTDPFTGISTFDCDLQDCFLAAIDKHNSLPDDYKPELVKAHGTWLVPKASEHLGLLLAGLKDNGVNAVVTSSYRSYNTQSSTFKGWVKSAKHKDSGLTQAEAETEANTVSAHAGHSEHQLGATVDINTVGARALNDKGNEDLYEFIENHGHEYGFVITYPTGQAEITGYRHEPWHIRYIGVDLATELHALNYQSGNGITSTTFLRTKGLSD